MIEVVRGDITTLRVDAIVNAANPQLTGGSGVDGAIHRAAGPELAIASKRLAPCRTGDAKITPAFRLSARYVIHTVGPVWQNGTNKEADMLRSAYVRSFEVALSAGDIRTIALPSISTGVYGFPKREAAEIAVDVMRKYEKDFQKIIACVFGEEDERLYRSLIARPANG